MTAEVEDEKRSKTAIPGAQRGTIFMMDPRDLIIIKERDHPRFDKRALIEPTPKFIQSIRRFGVRQSVEIFKDGRDPSGKDRFLVTAGRKRVAAALVVTLENIANGLPVCYVPCVLKKVDDKTAFAVMIMENEQRVDDDVLDKAEKAAMFQDIHNATDEETIEVFGVTKRTLALWLRVHGLHMSVKAAVREGKISASKAERLADLPMTEQPAFLQKLIDAGNTKGDSFDAAVRLAVATRPSGPEEKEEASAKDTAFERHEGRTKGGGAKPREKNRAKIGAAPPNTETMPDKLIVPVKPRRALSLLLALRKDPSIEVPEEYKTALSWVVGELPDEKFAKKMKLKELPA